MRSPQAAWTLGGFALAFGLAASALYALNWRFDLWPAVVAWFLAVTLVTFAFYGIDKRMAGRGGRRVPELALQALAAAGGSLGAYLGMRLFRHKTIKGKFRVVFWLIVATQAVVLAWAVKNAWGASAVR